MPTYLFTYLLTYLRTYVLAYICTYLRRPRASRRKLFKQRAGQATQKAPDAPFHMENRIITCQIIYLHMLSPAYLHGCMFATLFSCMLISLLTDLLNLACISLHMEARCKSSQGLTAKTFRSKAGTKSANHSTIRQANGSWTRQLYETSRKRLPSRHLGKQRYFYREPFDAGHSNSSQASV